MKDKYKPIIIGILFGALLLLPFFASIATPVTVNTRNGIGGGSIGTSGNSTTFFPANNTASGGIWISCNNTFVDRLNRDVKFTVDATAMVNQPGGWDPIWGADVDRCYLNVTLPDNTTDSYPMSETGTQIFSYTLETTITMNIGLYRFRATIENSSRRYNGGFDFTNVTIMTVYNILPVGSILTNTTTVYRNGTIAFFISIFDPETPFPSLLWNVSLYKNGSSPVKMKTWFKNDTLNQTYTFKGTNITGDYAFRVQIRDGSNGPFDLYVSWFKVLSNPPVINSVSFNYTANLKREVEKLRFEVNLNDSDSNKTLTDVRVIFEYVPPEVFPGVVYYNFTSPALKYIAATGNFTGNVTVPKAFPAGTSKIIIEAKDNDPNPGIARFHTTPETITVVNNIPALHGVTINGKSLTGGLRFSVYNNLDFSVNVSDIENKIDYVQVVLDGPPGYANISYFILGPSPYEVRIPASALAPGSWGVFIIVADTEGGKLVANVSGIIEVDPDLRDVTAYIIGGVLLAIVGFVIGGMVIWRYANARISAMRRDMIIKAKSKDVQEAKKGKPGEKGAPSKYVEIPAKAEPEQKPEQKPPAKAAEKPAGNKPFVGTQAPPAKGKQPAPDKKADASKPKPK
jgi:hypothetical protein